jgi:hypothetical protein
MQSNNDRGGEKMQDLVKAYEYYRDREKHLNAEEKAHLRNLEKKIALAYQMEEKFLRYEEVRKSGQFNMITEANQAMDYANLGEDDYWDIIQNYSEYKEMFLKEEK